MEKTAFKTPRVSRAYSRGVRAFFAGDPLPLRCSREFHLGWMDAANAPIHDPALDALFHGEIAR